MENRWKFSFTSDQLNKLIYVTWVNDDRPMPASLPKESEESVISLSKDKMPEKPIGNLERLQLKFWTEFVEYCKANSGVHEKYGRQNFCISKAANKYPIAFMKWSFEDPNITFTHKDGYDASLEYAKVSSVKTGSTVTTKFGSGLVVETKDNGLFLFQPSRNATLAKWITVDDLR